MFLVHSVGKALKQCYTPAMLTDPELVLARFGHYPNLNTFIDRKWVRRTVTHRSVTIWYPFFDDDDAITAGILESIDNVIGRLLQAQVAGVETRAKGLCASSYDNFWSSWTELAQGAKLSTRYPIRYLPKQRGAQTPDIELNISGTDYVYIEITAMHKTWDFTAIQRYLYDAIGNVQHGYRIGVTCSSDTIKIPEALLDELAGRVREYITAQPFPGDGSNELVYRSVDGRIAVNLQRSDAEGYRVTHTGAHASRSPDASFGHIINRLREKATQVENYRPSVVIIELAHDAANVARLGYPNSNIWQIYGSLFRLEEIPSTIDLVILTWQDLYGKTWGNARALRNPTSTWAQSAEAESVYSLIADLSEHISI